MGSMLNCKTDSAYSKSLKSAFCLHQKWSRFREVVMTQGLTDNTAAVQSQKLTARLSRKKNPIRPVKSVSKVRELRQGLNQQD